jgi:hypothetical protein
MTRMIPYLKNKKIVNNSLVFFIRVLMNDLYLSETMLVINMISIKSIKHSVIGVTLILIVT